MSKPTDLAQLTEMQIYIGRDTIDEYRAGHITRRAMLRRLTLVCGGALGAASLLAACGDSQNAQMILDAGATAGADAGSPRDAGSSADAAAAPRPPGALS